LGLRVHADTVRVVGGPVWRAANIRSRLYLLVSHVGFDGADKRPGDADSIADIAGSRSGGGFPGQFARRRQLVSGERTGTRHGTLSGRSPVRGRADPGLRRVVPDQIRLALVVRGDWRSVAGLGRALDGLFEKMGGGGN